MSYVGHATLLLEVGKTRLLTDPLLGPGIGHIRRRVAVPVVKDLLPLDAVLISHAHHDHLHPASLRSVAHDCPVVGPAGCVQMLKRSGARQVNGVEVGDRVAVGETMVEALPAVHDGRRYPVGRRAAALGFLIEGPVSIYFAGDTDLFPEMEELAGRVDVAALPVWGWGPRVPAGHLDPEGAARAAAAIRPSVVIPIHWGTLTAIGSQRGMDPLDPPRAFARAVERLAPDIEVRVLNPGERSVLD